PLPGVPSAVHRASALVPGAFGTAPRRAHPLRAAHDGRLAVQSWRRPDTSGNAAMSWAIWITGLPGSGKSVLARATAAELRAGGDTVVVLELDEIRKIVTPSPTYTDTERDVLYRALVYMAATLTKSGTPVIIDATAHRRAWRELARRLIPTFAEVQLVCPLELCRERERERVHCNAPPKIYARAGRPDAPVPGADV